MPKRSFRDDNLKDVFNKVITARAIARGEKGATRNIEKVSEMNTQKLEQNLLLMNEVASLADVKSPLDQE